jgi:biopolymer transport protein TolQ
MMTNPLISTFLQAGLVGQLIIIVLFFFSVYVWCIIYEKYQLFRKAGRGDDFFLERYGKIKDDIFYLDSGTHAVPSSPLYKVYRAGCRETAKYLEGEEDVSSASKRRTSRLTEAHLDGLSNALTLAISRQIVLLERGLTFLATTAAVGPLLGLLGTVWGIMSAFRAMSVAGNASIGTVAPGIADALITTVAGLFVAIPAVVAYNYLFGKVRSFSSDMNMFAGNFLSRVERLYVRR